MRRRDQTGAVTAEAAAVLPVVCLVALMLGWMVGLGVTHVRAVDAAREVARSVARGDAPAQGLDLGRQVAPDQAQISVDRAGGKVLVTVQVPVRGPAGLLDFLPEHRVTARAVAVDESP